MVPAAVLIAGISVRAASVIANVSSGTLMVQATSGSQTVDIHQNGANWIVRGLDGTSINGKSWRLFTGVTNIVTLLGSGNDTLHIHDGDLSGTLTVVYGSSDKGIKKTSLDNLSVNALTYTSSQNNLNYLNVNGIFATMNVVLVFGDGPNTVNLEHTESFNGFTVVVGDGNNNLNIIDDNSGFIFGSPVTVVAGDGNNTIHVAGLYAGNLIVQAGDGANTIRANNIQTFDFGYTAILKPNVTPHIPIGEDVFVAGTGPNLIQLYNYNTQNELIVVPEGNNNLVQISKSSAPYLTVNAGPIIEVLNGSFGLAVFSDSYGKGALHLLGNSFSSLTVDPSLKLIP